MPLWHGPTRVLGGFSGWDSPGILTEVQVDKFGEHAGEEADEEGHGDVGEERGQEEGAQPGEPEGPGPAREAFVSTSPPIPKDLGCSGAGSTFPIPAVRVARSFFLRGPEADLNPSGSGNWICTSVLCLAFRD